MKRTVGLRTLLEQLVVWREDAGEMVAGIDREAFLADKRTQYAASKCIEGTGEYAQRILRDHQSFAAEHPELPLAETYRMRNRLVQAYEQVDLDVLWDSAKRGAPELAVLLRALLPTIPSDEP